MKKFLTVCMLLLSASSQKAVAQLLPPLQPEQDACNALLLCGNTFFSPYSYVGIGSILDLSNTPCSGGEANAIWFRLNVSAAGTIMFTITPVAVTDDYDFAVVDMTGSSCSNLSAAPVIRCNFNNNSPGSNVNGVVGCGPSGTMNYVGAGVFGNSFCNTINANAGDVILIMINNFGFYSGIGGPSSGFTLDFTGSTATFNGPNPTIAAVIPSCNNSQEITIQMSEPIKCSSIEPNGTDFSLSSGSIVSATGTNCTGLTGYSTFIKLNFGAPLPPGPYVLSVQNGTDNNNLLNLCDHPVLLPHSIPFTVNPYVPLGFAVVDTPACSEIRVAMTGKVNCDSIAANGSDFDLVGPQSATIVSAYGVGCDTTNFSDTILIILQAPLQTDGIYTLSAKNGVDGNTQIDSCGQKQVFGDAIGFTINSLDGRIVGAPDSVLCKAGYITLRSENTSDPPFAPVTCGLNNDPCTGSINAAFVASGKGSVSVLNTPFNGQYQDAREQFMYLGDELKRMGLKAGSIRKLEWLVTQKLSSIPYDNFTIKLGCTSLPLLSGGFISNLQTVYTGSYSSVAGWNSFDLITAFNWDGSSNLVVEVCYDNAGVSSNDQIVHGNTSFPSVYHRYGNNLTGCNITTEGFLETNSTLRPKTRFYICEPLPGNPPYTWSPGNFTDDSTLQNPLAFINTTVNYTVSTIDKYGCIHKDPVQVTLSVRNPDIMPDTTAILCFGESLALHASGGINYQWLTLDPATMSCLTCTDPIVSPVVNSVYSAVISDSYGCADTLSANIVVNPLPSVDAQPDDALVKYGGTLQMTVGGAYLYSWFPAGYLSNPFITTPTAIITEPVIFVVYGIDENGCRNSDSVRVQVDYTDPVFVPTAFTPNGDGRNDLFHIGSLLFQKLQEFRVFNRWGQEVFSTNDPKQGWDGTFKGQPQETGVYQYLIRLSYPDGKVELYKGDVTLIR